MSSFIEFLLSEKYLMAIKKEKTVLECPSNIELYLKISLILHK